MTAGSNRGRRARKRRRSAGAGRTSAGSAPAGDATGSTTGGPAAPVAQPPAERNGGDEAASPKGVSRSRSEAKNAAVRESLEPLAEGERPAAVTVAAIVAFLLAAGNLVLYLGGFEVGGERPSPLSLVFPTLLLVAAWGMWRARYWAVLGMQAVLALVLVGFSLNLMFAVTSDDFLIAAISLAVITGAGLLFWFMVKAMARIQMPERR